MTSSAKISLHTPRPRGIALAAFVILSFSLVSAGALGAKQATYDTAQDAVDALVAAVKAGTTDGIVAVLGPEGQSLASSGDTVADTSARERFISAYEEAHEIKQDAEKRWILIIGKDEFPFPIPIVEEGGALRFDTEAGAEEILDRRIGENELAAIKAAQAYVDAQREYAEADRDGKGPQYARKFLSSDGNQDGLYWPTAEGETESPLGPLIVNARVEGYQKKTTGPEPYHGYLFRILTAQGKDAPGGAQDYIVKGRMIGGFGLVAAPAEYANSGVMTFIVNQDGEVFQKNLGPNSSSIAAGMNAFNPDSTWTKVSKP